MRSPLDISAVEKDLAPVSGLDRYETVTWRMTRDAGRGYGLRVVGRLKAYAPPLLMLGLNLENTTSSDFNITATGRYLGFDIVGSGSELRVDGTIGSNPSVGIEMYRPLWRTPLFVHMRASARSHSTSSRMMRWFALRPDCARVGLNLGVNLGARSDCAWALIGRTTATIEVGNQDFLNCRARRRAPRSRGVWTQDGPSCPRWGLSRVRLSALSSTRYPSPLRESRQSVSR